MLGEMLEYELRHGHGQRFYKTVFEQRDKSSHQRHRVKRRGNDAIEFRGFFAILTGSIFKRRRIAHGACGHFRNRDTRKTRRTQVRAIYAAPQTFYGENKVEKKVFCGGSEGKSFSKHSAL